MYQHANYSNHFGTANSGCKPKKLATDTLIIFLKHLGMLVYIMHDNNLIYPMNNIAFRIQSARLTVDFYGKSLANVK